MNNLIKTSPLEDDHLVLMILARVPYHGRTYKQLRLVNQRFNRLVGNWENATALPTMIARRQYTPFYQLANAIGGTGGYRWADLY